MTRWPSQVVRTVCPYMRETPPMMAATYAPASLASSGASPLGMASSKAIRVSHGPTTCRSDATIRTATARTTYHR